jgi:hypothetical protein
MSENIPVATKPRPQCNNDYRPVALPAVAMKCLEKMAKSRLLIEIDYYKRHYLHTPRTDVFSIPQRGGPGPAGAPKVGVGVLVTLSPLK